MTDTEHSERSERRHTPRIEDEGLFVKLHIGDFDAVTHTLNLSTSGIYCKVEREIPLMSRVRLMLEIPDQSKADRPLTSLEVDGVVVREHPVIINDEIRHYDVAIFFDNLSPKDTEIISGYISRKNT